MRNLVLIFLLSLATAANAVVCSVGANPYAVSSNNAISGKTAAAACFAWVVSLGANYEYRAFEGGHCLAQDTATKVNVAERIDQLCTDESPLYSELADSGLTVGKVQDYMALWALILLAAVVVLCGKALYNRFRIEHDRS